MQQTCSRCGALLAPGASLCPTCGTPVPANTSQQQGNTDAKWQADHTLRPETPAGAGRASRPLAPATMQQSQAAAPPATLAPPRPSARRQKRSPALLIGIIALAVVLGLSLGAAGVLLFGNGAHNASTHTAATPTTTASTIPSLYQASLTSNPGDWQCTTATTCAFKKDGYHINGIEKGFVSDSLLTKRTFDNMVIEVKAVIAQGDPQNAGIGIEFHVPQASPGAGYGFFIYDDGTFDVQKWDAKGNSSDLVGTTPSGLLPLGLNQPNDLKIVIDGTQFTFFDNGQQIVTTSDATYASGYIGLAAAEQGTEVVFSDLLITNPSTSPS